MKKLFILTTALVFSISCSQKDSEDIVVPYSTDENKTTNILTLGASRVEGNPSYHESFRYDLWKLFLEEELTFNYIGTQKDDFVYSNFKGFVFDNDHEGYSGWTSAQLLEQIPKTLKQTVRPDIVLFSSPGGNDLLSTNYNYGAVLSNINAIIDTLQKKNPTVTIVLEKLASGNPLIMTKERSDLFATIRSDVETIALSQSTAQSRVITVDMNDGFQGSYLADLIHYNSEGAYFIAKKYFDIVKTLIEN